MKRGRPKGRSRDNRSFGPLGDLIRKHRLDKGLGLSDVAKACQCSVQFISNIEHGRAPLPWDKAASLSSVLKIALEDLQVANLAIRSDFKSFVSNSKGGKRVTKPLVLEAMAGAASAVAFASKDGQLQEVIQKYQTASVASRKKFVRAALDLLTH
jgi:transcriptional regulator with XRE-family HTH domain